MIDYKAIADGDPNDGDDEAYLAALRDETIADGASENHKTYIKIAHEVNFLTATVLEKVVKAAVASGDLPEWVDKALAGDSGIDINNSQTVDALTGLAAAPGSPLTQDMATAIVASGVKITPRHPGVQLMHVHKARHLRSIGAV